MVEKHKEGIIDLLQNTEATDELYACLISYSPSQHHSVYERIHFPTQFLTVIRNMVGVILFTYPYNRGLSVSVPLHRTLPMAEKPTMLC